MRRQIVKWLAALLLCCGLTAVSAGDLIVDPCTVASNWIFVNGGEFPGATGSLRFDPATGHLGLNYDFTGGGRYVAAISRCPIPAAAESLTFALLPTQDCEVNLRLVDANGRTFQRQTQRLTGGVRTPLRISGQDTWSAAWGGTDGAAPQMPWREVWLMAGMADNLPKAGSVLMESLTADGAQLTASPFKAEPFTVEFNGAGLRGEWLPCTDGALLSLAASLPAGADDWEAVFDFPQNGRALIRRFRLAAGAETTLLVPFPAQNPRNRYEIGFTLSNGTEQMKRELLLAGDEAAQLPFGLPKNAADIRTTRFGSCAHFSYGADPQGPFKGWHPWKELIDDMARCGMKLVRDGASIEKDASGQYRVRAYDHEWIEYARSKGLGVILVIDLNAHMTQEEFAQLCAGAAADTAGLVQVFEVGNEPNNFGDWIKTYGGTWNGKEADNSTSRWVLENLKYANAGAEAIKSVRPDAIVIGTGACSPTNIRYLDAGLSKAMDGIVDHPYTYSMPPEQVPFGLQLLERDGVAIGDEGHSFVGLVHSYQEHFKRTGVERTLWFTEYGFTTFRFDGKNETGLYAGFTEEAQALYLLRRQLLTLDLPVVKASSQYDYIDDYGSTPYEAEANFGLVRADGSHKPAWYVLQRFNSLLAECGPAQGVQAKVVAAPLHRSMERGVLVKDWDSVAFKADNSVLAQAVENPFDGTRMLLVWNAQPYSGEFNNRSVSLEVTGWSDAALPLVAIDLVSGRSYDVAAETDGGALKIQGLDLGMAPVALRFDRQK